ncbi:DUF1501 domain-containing protein [Oceanospirillum sanctuarii]|uniref:DUF1501 domain-containing protein n=1 Tax=Oceanospirillum sanctuarii TaxID=1434821 RepID=UPI0015948C1B|nr:DUF1501 domain-containing protein [Oceanospirillum sanctuarii]
MSISRRSFLKGTAGVIGAGLLPWSFSSKVLAASQTYSVIEVFLYGGASSAVSELGMLKASEVPGFNVNSKTATTNGFWQESGGDVLEDLLTRNRLTQLSVVPLHSSKAHDFSQSYGTLGQASDIPDSIALAATGDGAKAFAGRKSGYFPFDANLQNVFTRSGWRYEVKDNPDDTTQNEFSPLLDLYAAQGSQIHTDFTAAGAQLDQARTIKENYENSQANSFFQNNDIGNQLRAAVALIQSQNKTHYISMPYGGWDMHSNSDDQYTTRMSSLLRGVHTASEMIDQSGLPIVIVLRGDFGRNYRYNDSNGWDHGDHQVMLIAGGAGMMNHYGKYFSSKFDEDTDLNGTRIYSKPTGDYPVLDLSEVRALQLELMGVSVSESVSKVAANSFMWSLDFPDQDTPSSYASALSSRYQTLKTKINL